MGRASARDQEKNPKMAECLLSRRAQRPGAQTDTNTAGETLVDSHTRNQNLLKIPLRVDSPATTSCVRLNVHE